MAFRNGLKPPNPPQSHAIDQQGPFLGQRCPFLGPDVPFFGPGVPFLGRSVPFLGRSVPFFGQGCPFFGPSVPFFGQSVPFFGQSRPFFGQCCPFFGQCCPFLEQSVPFGATTLLSWMAAPVLPVVARSSSRDRGLPARPRSEPQMKNQRSSAPLGAELPSTAGWSRAPALRSARCSAHARWFRLCRMRRGALHGPRPSVRPRSEEPKKSPRKAQPAGSIEPQVTQTPPSDPPDRSRSGLHRHHRRQSSGKNARVALLSVLEGSPTGRYRESVSNDPIHEALLPANWIKTRPAPVKTIESRVA
jgi:hypothetical protein